MIICNNFGDPFTLRGWTYSEWKRFTIIGIIVLMNQSN